MGSLKTSAGTNFAGKEASSYWAMPFTRKRPMASPHLHFLLLLLSLVECASASDILLVTDQNSHEAIKRTPLAHLFADNHFETNENDAATFRVLTTNTHRWDELDFGDGVSLQVQRSNHSFNLTTMLLQTYDYQMHPADAGFLYDIVRHSNAGVALLQIGEKDTTEFNKVVRSAANCTHRGKLLIDIPHTIYFCNHIEVSNIPFYDSTAVEELSAGHRSTQSKFMREFYEETEEIRREMSEEERKLSCKYRKSCYETGKLPQIEQETIKTIADTMKETTLSLHLRCKYRKSCYANYGIPAIKDTKRMPKPEAVIEKPSTSTVGEQAKVRTTEDQRKPHPPTTVDESDKKKTTKKSKKSEKKQDIEEELPYMQRALSEEKRPTTLALAQKLKCKYRIKCYEGVPMHKVLHEIKKETIPIKNFQRADGRPCTIYHLSCRRMAGLPIKQRAPIGPNGRRLCRKKPKAEAAAK
uniref:Titin n=1 Tax=Parascaris univalens TaxID=6257 RepID=A0A915AM53_PARUN